MVRKQTFLAVLALTVTLAAPLSAADGWTPELALEVKQIGNVVPSPDGERVVFQVAIAVMEDERSEWLTHVHVAAADGSSGFQLTRGDSSAHSPAWSPDGAWIAFVSDRGGQADLWRIRVDGGEAERLTEVETGVADFAWSPDGSRIAFLMRDPESEEEKARQREKRDARLVDRAFRHVRLHVVPVEPDADGERPVRLLTDDDFSVGQGFSGRAFDWSPDGGEIVFSHLPTPRVDDWPLADLSVVDVESGEVRSLVATGAAATEPHYSPDGTRIAYVASDDPPTWGFTGRVHIVPAGGGEPRRLAPTIDERPTLLGWSGDGARLLVAETRRTINVLAAVPIDGGPASDVSAAGLMVTSPTLGPGGTRVGFVSEAHDRAPEAYVAALEGFDPTQVSRVQELPDLPMGRTEVITWSAPDGLEIEGLVTYPVGYRQGERVPLLVVVHGGPMGVFVDRFLARRGAYPIAAFASRGFAVLRPNVRGSSGYGRAFRYANYADWGGGDYQDILSGVDHLVEAGVADPERLGVMGWSYGGFMTSWIIGQTDRFAAASVGAAVTNLFSFTGTADIPSFIPDFFRSEFWEDPELWRRHSPISHLAGATTPTLIQHGEEDRRVPISQGYELYTALDRLGVEVEMVVYPRQPHGIQEPKLQLDAMRRNLEWFERWLEP